MANSPDVAGNKIDPKALRGFEQVLFILEGLCDGDLNAEIIEKFHGDTELVFMWLNFLKQNHWVYFDTTKAKYKLTEKGREWAIGKTR